VVEACVNDAVSGDGATAQARDVLKITAMHIGASNGK
jgi:hypothetical protein